jgi:hypothetical protein
MRSKAPTAVTKAPVIPRKLTDAVEVGSDIT